MKKEKKFILWFKEISHKDVPLVGGKNASLGEMYRNLTKKGVNVPNGFALTSYAYFYFLEKAGIKQKIAEILRTYNLNKVTELQKAGKLIRSTILKATFPPELEEEILKNYQKLSKEYGDINTDVAVRSSATAEDLPSASFAGQQETYLNVKGEEQLLNAVKKCIASLFTDRAISYREEKGFPHLKIALSVGIQKMVRSDLGSSGVMFSLDTETGFSNVVLINSIWGVGEMIVQGKITPDEFFVFKPTLKKGYKSIIVKNLGRKTKKLIYNKAGGLKEVIVPQKNQLKFSLTDDEILTLAKWACLIEEHYSKLAKKWLPQDIEWAKDGKTGQLFIVQARPETVHSQKKPTIYQEYQIKTKKEPILTGIAVGDKIGEGKVRIIESAKKMSEFKKGEILITRMTDPDWMPAIRIASGIITDEGGKTCFAKGTLVLTNKGPLPIEKVVEQVNKGANFFVLSFNKNKFSLEWKKVEKGMERKSTTIEIACSQTGKTNKNSLRVTPDHKFITFQNRKLVSFEIQKILNQRLGILSINRVPSKKSLTLNPKLGYLLGAITTDGHIVYRNYKNKLSAQLFFVQKPTKEKSAFIKKVKECFIDIYNYRLHTLRKPAGGGYIKDRKIRGEGSICLKCYKKKIIEDFLYYQNSLPSFILNAKKPFLLNFLAGVIDGDGTLSEGSLKNRNRQRINIYCSKEKLLQAIIIACLRLGIKYQVTSNRNIYNIQLIENFEEILKFTKRVKLKKGLLKTKKGEYFLAKQLLEDIKEKINYSGKVLPYINKNLLMSAKAIQDYVIPSIKGTSPNHELTKIISSSLRMLRVSIAKNSTKRKERVYNLTVQDNHNYFVFTKYLTPILVENCHAAIVSRELGIPCIVGTQKATKVLKTGQYVTVDCTQGLKGRIFEGKVDYKIKRYNLEKLPKPKTKIVVNIGAPEIAFKTSFLPVDGVGLAREEFIIAQKIKVHPLALYYYKQLKEKKLNNLPLVRKVNAQELKKLVKKIEEITVEHKDKKEYFIKELAEGIGQIGAAFWPNEVIVRFSDFKTNEYAQLVGGHLFEPEEENPMIGWRGASRYYDPRFAPAFGMECRAIKRVRDVFGLKNVVVMIPFCRTPEEGRKVLDLMAKYGLKRGKDGLKVYVMCEIPSNVILADEFLKIFDGMSIGSNDLTQLTLGMDRDNAQIAHIGDERNEAVKKLISEVIKKCRQKKKYVGICGDAPSTFIEFAKFLEKEGIEAMSLSPDAVIKTILKLAKRR